MTKFFTVFVTFIYLLLCGAVSAQLPGTFQPLLLAAMPIKPPVSLTSAFGAGGVNSVSITNVAVSGGDTIVVGCGGNKGSTITVSSVSDGTNTYTKAVGGYSATNDYDSEIWVSFNVVTISSATLTCTFSTTSDAGPGIAAVSVTGLLGPKDQTASGNSNGTTSPSAGPTGTLAQANELAIGFLWSGGGGGTITESTGFTAAVDSHPSPSVHLGYKIVQATTALTYNPTSGSSVAWGTQLATFKGY